MQKYSSFSIFIHWLMALLIIGMMVLGFYMVDLEKGSAERTYFFGLHKSMGLTLALLVVMRLLWKIKAKAPALPEYITGWKRISATATHHTLYLLMFVQPMSGYISSSFSGYKTKFWGIPLPHWGWKAPELNEFFTGIHDISSKLLLILIVFHIAGAIYHIAKGETGIIKRMIPFGK